MEYEQWNDIKRIVQGWASEHELSPTDVLMIFQRGFLVWLQEEKTKDCSACGIHRIDDHTSYCPKCGRNVQVRK